MQGDFFMGKDKLKNGTGDVLLSPVVVTTTDSEEFDFSIPLLKSW